MTRIAINGFGRIGRNTLRALLERGSDPEVVALNHPTAPPTASGRIARNPPRPRRERAPALEVAATTALPPPPPLPPLLKYDSSLGRLGRTVEVDGDALVVDGPRIRVLAERAPADLPWA